MYVLPFILVIILLSGTKLIYKTIYVVYKQGLKITKFCPKTTETEGVQEGWHLDGRVQAEGGQHGQVAGGRG